MGIILLLQGNRSGFGTLFSEDEGEEENQIGEQRQKEGGKAPQEQHAAEKRIADEIAVDHRENDLGGAASAGYGDDVVDVGRGYAEQVAVEKCGEAIPLSGDQKVADVGQGRMDHQKDQMEQDQGKLSVEAVKDHPDLLLEDEHLLLLLCDVGFLFGNSLQTVENGGGYADQQVLKPPGIGHDTEKGQRQQMKAQTDEDDGDEGQAYVLKGEIQRMKQQDGAQDRIEEDAGETVENLRLGDGRQRFLQREASLGLKVQLHRVIAGFEGGDAASQMPHHHIAEGVEERPFPVHFSIESIIDIGIDQIAEEEESVDEKHHRRMQLMKALSGDDPALPEIKKGQSGDTRQEDEVQEVALEILFVLHIINISPFCKIIILSGALKSIMKGEVDAMELMRLQKVMAERGICSRRKAEELIAQGKVRVDGKIFTEMGIKVAPTVKIEVEGLDVSDIVTEKVTFVFNKPLGVVSSAKDDRGRPTVIDYFRKEPYRLYPVGRLDFNTSGCLLVTNDGELSQLVTHPSSHLEKTYIVTVEGMISDRALRALHDGVMLEDGPTQPAKIALGKRTDEVSIFKISIHEGRNRQIRRMCEAVGYSIRSLHRESVGGIMLGALKRGEYRLLSEEETEELKRRCRKNRETNVIPESKKKDIKY